MFCDPSDHMETRLKELAVSHNLAFIQLGAVVQCDYNAAISDMLSKKYNHAVKISQFSILMQHKE